LSVHPNAQGELWSNGFDNLSGLRFIPTCMGNSSEES